MDKEQDELRGLASLPESVPDFLGANRDEPAVIRAELLLDGRQVSGEIRCGGVPRRLIDILNALDNGTIRDRSDSCLEFDLIQIARNSILVAFPHQGSASRTNPGEVIKKHRRLVTVIMPGCQVSGYFHVASGVDPAVASASAAGRFIALTDVTVTILDSNTPTRFESIAVVNAAHAEAYVWSDEVKSPASSSRNAEAFADESQVPSDSPAL